LPGAKSDNVVSRRDVCGSGNRKHDYAHSGGRLRHCADAGKRVHDLTPGRSTADGNVVGSWRPRPCPLTSARIFSCSGCSYSCALSLQSSRSRARDLGHRHCRHLM